MLNIAIAVVASYLIGALPTGYLLARLRGLDIRNHGSGGTGATNILRALGWKSAVVTGLVDVGKGVAGVALGLWAGGGFGHWALALTIIAAVAGHAWPVYIGFRGGKSVATALGIVFWLAPVPTAIGLTVFVACVGLTRFVSLGSIIGTLTVCLQVLVGSAYEWPVKLGVLGVTAIVIWRHHENIGRLLAGNENRLGQKRA